MSQQGIQLMCDQGVRKAVLQIVSALVPLDSREEQHIEFIKRWILSGADLIRVTKPNIPNIHLVSYFVVVDEQRIECLLVDHKSSGLWLPPGGHVELGEYPAETVKREAKEELGIEADFLFKEPCFVTVTDTPGEVEKHTDVSLWYVLKGNKSENLIYDVEEFHQIRWFPWETIPLDRSDPHMKRFIDKILPKLADLNSKK